MTNRVRKIGRLAVPLGQRVGLKEGEASFANRKVSSAEQLGEALRLRRRELGYTQQTAAELCNHSVRVIGEIERGRATVGIGVILDYALVLGINLELTGR